MLTMNFYTVPLLLLGWMFRSSIFPSYSPTPTLIPDVSFPSTRPLTCPWKPQILQWWRTLEYLLSCVFLFPGQGQRYQPSHPRRYLFQGISLNLDCEGRNRDSFRLFWSLATSQFPGQHEAWRHPRSTEKHGRAWLCAHKALLVDARIKISYDFRGSAKILLFILHHRKRTILSKLVAIQIQVDVKPCQGPLFSKPCL